MSLILGMAPYANCTTAFLYDLYRDHAPDKASQRETLVQKIRSAKISRFAVLIAITKPNTQQFSSVEEFFIQQGFKSSDPIQNDKYGQGHELKVWHLELASWKDPKAKKKPERKDNPFAAGVADAQAIRQREEGAVNHQVIAAAAGIQYQNPSPQSNRVAVAAQFSPNTSLNGANRPQWDGVQLRDPFPRDVWVALPATITVCPGILRNTECTVVLVSGGNQEVVGDRRIGQRWVWELRPDNLSRIAFVKRTGKYR